MTTTRVHAKHGAWFYVEDLAERKPARLVDGKLVPGRPKQKWHKLSRVVDGEAALHEALARFHGRPVEADRGDVKTLLAEHARVHFPTLTFGVRKEYERMYGVIGEEFAEFNAVEVEPGDVLEFLNLKFATRWTARRAYKARLSTFFSWCALNAGRTGVKANPCSVISLPGAPKRKGRMSAQVYWAMHAALPEVGRLFLELSYASRQRPTEIRLLRESALRANRVRFEPTKTLRTSGGYVEITRSPWINAMLERLRELRGERLKARKVIPLDEQRDPFLLVCEDGTPFTKSGLNTVWRRAREKAAKDADQVMGEENLAHVVGKQQRRSTLACALLAVTTRDIRPFALSRMEQDGHTVEAIREAAVHTTTGMTEQYLNQHRERYSSAVLTPPPRE
jgi:hypothetical protein